MNNDKFDNKIAEILTEHEEQLPKMQNKEHVWDNIEQKLNPKKSNRRIWFTAFSAAASVAILIGFFSVWFYKESPVSVDKYQKQQFSNIAEDTAEINTNIQLGNQTEDASAAENKFFPKIQPQNAQNSKHQPFIDTLTLQKKTDETTDYIVENIGNEQKQVAENKITIYVSLAPREKESLSKEMAGIQRFGVNMVASQSVCISENNQSKSQYGIQIPLK